MKKKMSKTSRRWFKEFLDHFYELDADRLDLASELSGENKKAIELLKLVKPWGELYSHSAAEIVISFFGQIGMLQKLLDLVRSKPTIEEYQAFFEDLWRGDAQELADDRLDRMTDEERGQCFATLFAMTGNMDGLKFYSLSVSELIQLAEDSNPVAAKDAILKAVAVDRVALSNSTVAKRIALAQIAQDNSFMHELTRSITRTKPRRKHELDHFRYMAEVIDEAEGLARYSIEELTDVFVNTLQVLPHDATSDAVKKNFQKRKNPMGK